MNLPLNKGDQWEDLNIFGSSNTHLAYFSCYKFKFIIIFNFNFCLVDHNISLVSMEVTVNAVAGALKAFFADLPDPLIPYSLHPELLEAASKYKPFFFFEWDDDSGVCTLVAVC